MTINTDPIGIAALCLLCFVAGVMFAAWRETQRRELRRWMRKQRSI